ncbi:MAG: 50S ribosomal protein L20 [Candidatus Caldatribacterium sp.]|uniref:50S ribosomal protein L20 n=1 Tax=Candidatus Caldatribacterium sp. TaxID=2282143 RepID=UPI00299BE4A1|nr:50S ribosomal protein L20 [Candidatus Caldatribacterium sp.]MCX7730435.1 50S ribosomal protein L20 [Candidatus Caldatribacterium sp.]MDW8080488.1 50S ribosomal protein L20 [Candidatus Calescibacterium sp.]
MARVKTNVASRERKKKIMKMAKGYRGARSRAYRRAKEQVMRSLAYAYRDRRNRKRDFRRLWILRINAAVRSEGLNYSRFIGALRKAGVLVNRKNLAQLSIGDPEAFRKLVEVAKAHL